MGKVYTQGLIFFLWIFCCWYFSCRFLVCFQPWILISGTLAGKAMVFHCYYFYSNSFKSRVSLSGQRDINSILTPSCGRFLRLNLPSASVWVWTFSRVFQWLFLKNNNKNKKLPHLLKILFLSLFSLGGFHDHFTPMTFLEVDF